MPSTEPWECPLCGERSDKWPKQVDVDLYEAECWHCWKKSTPPPSEPEGCRFRFESTTLLKGQPEDKKRRYISFCLSWEGQTPPYLPF